MSISPILSSLLQNLELNDSHLPTSTWESIQSESGSVPSPKPPKCPNDFIKDLESIYESSLSRLVINAFQGVKSAVVQICKISDALCSIPADRTVHQVQTLSYRTSSSNALGNTLKSICHSGHVVYFIKEFVKYYGGSPCSLVNQAFSVAVGKVMDGYICALNTLLVSVKVRRGLKCDDGERVFTSIADSDVTVLEIYLHSEELRVQIEALGNVCLMKDIDFEAEFEFDGFPRGADLLTYLYVLLRDADPGHYALLKYLFVQSYEPYNTFVHSWIYHARIDDPYEEFFVVHTSSEGIAKPDCIDGFSLSSTEERDCTSVPCFLKDVSCPLIRAGQQLEVLVKLLNLCNLSVMMDYKSCNLANLGDMLPFWAQLSGSETMLDQKNFSTNGIRKAMHNREVIYENVLEKLQDYFKKIDECQRVSPFISLPERRLGASSLFSLNFDGNLDNAFKTNGQENSNEDAVHRDTDDSSSDGESSQSLESSSSYSYEDESVSRYSELPDILNQQADILLSNLYTDNFKKNMSKNDQSDKHCLQDNCKVMDNNHGYDRKFSTSTHASQNPDASKCVKLSDTFDENIMSGKCWPLGELPKNPFYGTKRGEDESEVDFTEMFVRVPSIADSHGKDQKINQTACQTWNSCDIHDLSINPNLSKSSWLPKLRNVGVRDFIKSFDFSSVSDPCKSYSEISVSSEDHKPENKNPKSSISTTDEAVNKFGERVKESTRDHSVHNYVCSSKVTHGGSDWERLLKYSTDITSSNDVDESCDSAGTFEIPLDVIIDKATRQEILIQYKYISSFTIKLLKDGFDLHDHLVALRRYFFMEQADWADPFITSLFHQKWSVVEPEYKIAKIQSLLDFALQRSSCENDPYKERLFIRVKAQSMVSDPVSLIGLNAFEFMTLDYRVDWPINIIITQAALKTYADIFCYLIQIRLAVISLTDVWCWLKAEMNLTKHSRKGGSHRAGFTILMKMRQQISHFVHTLQKYVHSQLADVSWCHFQHSLQHGVKDMLDLETVHTSYLTDATLICFLSDETKSIAAIIKNILQCALDFRQCFPESIEPNVKENLNTWSQIKFSQISAVKTTFEKNIRDLYTLYLKSSKHGEYMLSRFWVYLNYNDYYSTTIDKGIGYLHH